MQIRATKFASLIEKVLFILLSLNQSLKVLLEIKLILFKLALEMDCKMRKKLFQLNKKSI